jgi:Zn-dependent protease with chaperone function
MSEMTATRIVLAATLTALWVGTAVLLWRTQVPDDLAMPSLSATKVFGRETLEAGERYARFLRWDAVALAAAQLGALVLLVRVRQRIANTLPGPAVVRAGLFGALGFVSLWLARLPFELAAHWWRRRHDISRVGYPGYIAGDWLTPLGELALAAIAAGLVVALARRLGRHWWMAAWAALVGGVVVWTLVTPALLSPRLKPLADHTLTEQIQELARKEGLGKTDVQVRKARERTRVINAEAVGAGPTTTVILWDTLLEPQVSRTEVLFVAAHELAHVARRHVWKGVGWFALLSLPCAWLLARIVRPTEPSDVPVAALVAACLALLLLPFANVVSRRYEREADWVALETTRDPAAAEAIFERFARTNLSDADPPAAWHFLLRTHPSLLQRVELSRAAALRAGPGSP